MARAVAPFPEAAITPKLLRAIDSRLLTHRISPRLLAEQNEAREILADKAEENIKEALWDPLDAQRRDSASKYVLSSLGRPRGWGTGPGKQININSEGGNILIQWADGTSVTSDDSGPIIDNEEAVNET